MKKTKSIIFLTFILSFTFLLYGCNNNQTESLENKTSNNAFITEDEIWNDASIIAKDRGRILFLRNPYVKDYF
ncbi:MAG: hypothetical protein RSC84_05355 [Peptostreptococcaceae bacterium]